MNILNKILYFLLECCQMSICFLKILVTAYNAIHWLKKTKLDFFNTICKETCVSEKLYQKIISLV